MGMIFCDSFDHYDDARINLKWSSNLAWGISSAAGRNGTSGGRSTRSDRYVRKDFAASYATLIVGFAYKHDSNPIGGSNTQDAIFSFLDGGARQVELALTPTGKLRVRRGSTELAQGGIIIGFGVSYYIEIKMTIHGSAGAFEVRVNGITDMNISGVDTNQTANNFTDGIGLSYNQDGTGTTRDYDDLYVIDPSGGTLTDFLGDVRVQALLPNGAGAASAWTPSAGSNFQNVDDTIPNDDTDYNSDAVAGDRDTYTFSNLVPTTGVVKAVQVLMYARKDDAGVRSIAPVVRHSGTNYDGTTQSIGTTYAYYGQIYELNPGTSAAWTVSNINTDDEFGIKLVA